MMTTTSHWGRGVPAPPEGLDNLLKAGSSLQDSSGMMERVEELITENEKHSSASILDIVQKPAYLASLVSLVDIVEKFANTLALGDSEARSLFRGIEVHKIHCILNRTYSCVYMTVDADNIIT
jgi:hypothetical protein